MSAGEFASTVAVSRAGGTPGAAALPRLRLVLELGKIRISALSTLSAATGAVLCARSAGWGLATLCAGVLAAAMGASALNQMQDRSYDARMERTRRRPIPRGAVRPSAAAAAGVFLVLLGAAVLALAHNVAAASLAAAAVLWYNALYAWLKRRWALAVIPGALIGALPPVIGWVSAGGAPWDAGALALALFFFLWQVPHFWLLALARAADYERVGLPSPVALLGVRGLSRLTAVWMLAAFASSLLLAPYGLKSAAWSGAALAALGLWVVPAALRLCGRRWQPGVHGRAFRFINIYALCVMALLVVGALL